MKITIREYQSSDIDSCRGLWAELTQRHRDIYADPTIGGDAPGIGKRLVEHVVQKAKNNNIRFLSVKPVARNVKAISFFIDAGFHIIGHIDLFQDLSLNSKREWKTGITIHGKELKY